jgi:colanic acid biosynthesis glycosyl transferase WcaI
MAVADRVLPEPPAADRRLLVISQVYAPDSAAVGQCVTDAAEEMVRRGWNVVVYTSARGYDDPSVRYPRREIRNGVPIHRLPLSSFGKGSIPVRLLAQLIFMVQAFVRGLCQGHLHAVLVSTSPPFAGFFGAVIACLRRVPLIWWVMDLNPDQMVAAGKLQQRSLPVRIFDWMNRVTLRQAAAIVVLDHYMAERVCSKLSFDPRRLHVIPPWPLVEDRETVPTTAANGFRRRHGLEDKFVVMYAGNHALQHPLDTLLDAARQLKDDAHVVFVFVGGGAGKAVVERRVAAGATNIVVMPYQPRETLADTLAAADVHVVSMGDDMVGIVHPCKIYGAMAAGRPILFFGPRESHAGRLVGPKSLGWQVAHGDVAAAVAAVREASGLPRERLDAIGRRAAALSAKSFSHRGLLTAFCDVIDTTTGDTSQ